MGQVLVARGARAEGGGGAGAAPWLFHRLAVASVQEPQPEGGRASGTARQVSLRPWGSAR